MNLLIALTICGFWFLLLVITYIILNNNYKNKSIELNYINMLQTETNNKNITLEKNLEILQNKYNNLLEERNFLNNKYEQLRLENQEVHIKISLQEKILNNYEGNLKEQKEDFKNIANDTLNNQTDSFLKKMDFFLQHFQNKQEDSSKSFNNILNPLIDSIKNFQEETKKMELNHISSNETIKESLKNLTSAYMGLKEATSLLTSSHKTAGQWGELQLIRLLEYTGLLKYCEFKEQVYINTDEGILKPDVVVNLPGNIHIAIDAKTSLISYNKFITSEKSDEKKKYQKEYYKAIKTHITALGNKKYWGQFTTSPEMVIMFLPGENFWQVAFDEDEEIIEYAYNMNVIVATPLTLIPLLRMVASLWGKFQISTEAENLKKQSLFLYETIIKINELINHMGKNFQESYKTFNKLMAFENHTQVALEKFREDYFPLLPPPKSY